MDYTKLSLANCFNLACSEFGLENPHTISIAKLKELAETGYLATEEATTMAQIIYHHGAESLYYNDEWDDEDDYDDLDIDESGFDPYMGCYTGDC